MLSSGAVWLLTSTEHGLKQKMEHSLSLPLEHASVPSQVKPPLPRISVSWTQPQSSASPSRSQVVSGHPPGALASDQNYVSSHLPEILLLWHFRRPNIFFLNLFLNPVFLNFVNCMRTPLSIRVSNEKKNSTLTFSVDLTTNGYVVTKNVRQNFFEWDLFEIWTM